MTRVAVLGDTHIPMRARDLPPRAWLLIDSSDVVIHTGDVTDGALLERISEQRPLHAVRGNNDLRLDELPEHLLLDIDDVPIAVVHDSGPARGRRERLRARWPDARVVAFGHSHVPWCEDDGELLLLNPGSPTDRRSMPTFTMAVMTLTAGRAHAQIVDLGRERA
ncbi:MAG: metallophosphatase family protein [Candidatus Dormibacteraeota bacterium]|nr:metallophosphatase family protein [Candidatus Dormibacteraeota bacterium]